MRTRKPDTVCNVRRWDLRMVIGAFVAVVGVLAVIGVVDAGDPSLEG